MVPRQKKGFKIYIPWFTLRYKFRIYIWKLNTCWRVIIRYIPDYFSAPFLSPRAGSGLICVCHSQWHAPDPCEAKWDRRSANGKFSLLLYNISKTYKIITTTKVGGWHYRLGTVSSQFNCGFKAGFKVALNLALSLSNLCLRISTVFIVIFRVVCVQLSLKQTHFLQGFEIAMWAKVFLIKHM